MEIKSKIHDRLPHKDVPTHLYPKKYTEEELDELHNEIETRDHVIPIQRLCEKLHTNSENGMTILEASKVFAKNGPNSLSPPPETPEYIKFLMCMFSGFAALLWCCGLLCFVIYTIERTFNYDSDGIEWFGTIIVIICMFSGIFAYIQESKNSKIMESFAQMMPLTATVIRSGNRIQIPAENVVVGDLVEIRMGDKIPADTRIFQCHGLRVETASITGSFQQV
jgi:sodium/potassium-transporting ATPase subunit alpha